MIYFSELRRKKVQTEDGIEIGKLEDLVFLALETPQITKILVSTPKKEKLIIPIENIIKLNSAVTINKNFQTAELALNELYVLKNLLDKQIIDLKGNKVVRVNDVVINDRPTFYVAGVDVGILAILRRLSLEYLFHKFSRFFFIKNQSHFLSWAEIQPLELTRGKVVLNVNQDKLKNLHPTDLADYLEKTNIKNITKIIDLLDKDLAIKVIAELNPNYQISLLKRLGYDKAVKIISLMDKDEAVELVSQFSQRRREKIMSMIDKVKKHEIEKALSLHSLSIGKYISTEFMVVKPENLVSDVINQIKKNSADITTLDYVFVTNNENKLIGVFNLHELLLLPLDTPVYKFMTQNVIVSHMSSPITTLMRRLIKYHLYALPIVNDDKKIIGIIKREDISENFLPKI